MVIRLFIYWIDYYVRGVIVVIRILRTFKLVRKWQSLNETLSILVKSSADIATFAILLALFIFMYAIIGMELFANIVKFDDNNAKDLINGKSPRFNFDDFSHAIISSFTLLIGETWGDVFFEYARFNQAAGVIYVISAEVMLNIFLVNLFLAILLQGFFVDEDQVKMQEEDRKDAKFNLRRMKTTRKGFNVVKRYHKQRTFLTALKTFRIILWLADVCKTKRQPEKVSEFYGDSLQIFGPNNSFRIFIGHIVKSSIFQYLSCAVIAINSIVLSFKTPLQDPNGSLCTIAYIIDLVTLGFFILEILMKTTAFGFISNGENSYLRSPWNILDFFITVISIVGLILNSSETWVEKVIMLFRVLRAVRVVTLNEGFRLCIQAIVQGSPKILQTIFVGGLFFLVFALISVHFFGGIFYYCDVDAVERININNVVTAYDCMNLGGEWRDRDINFNNILGSLMILFELFTGKSWNEMVEYLGDAVDVDYQPQYQINLARIWFIAAYMIIGFLFIRAVLTGVVSNTFFKEKEIIQGLNDLKFSQRKWVRLSKIIFKAAPIREVIYILVQCD